MVNAAPRVFRFRPPSESGIIPSAGEDRKKTGLFPGLKGVPLRNMDLSDPSNVTIEALSRCIVTRDIHFRIFDMMDPKERADYETLMSAAATMPNHVRVKEMVPATFGENGNWKLAVKWAEAFLEPKPYRGMMQLDGRALGQE